MNRRAQLLAKVMTDVPACGLSPKKTGFTTATHKVNLMYASAVPLQSEVNYASDPLHAELNLKIAEAAYACHI